MDSRITPLCVVRVGQRLILRCREAVLDADAANALARVLREAGDDDRTGAIVLQIPRVLSGLTNGTPAFTGLLDALCACIRPVIVSIEHDVRAETLPMVALSDVVIMLEQAHLQGGCAASDSAIDATVLQRLRVAMGYLKAFELVTLPRNWNAHECFRLGLVSRLASDREACGQLALALAEEVSFVTRSEAWRINRNNFGRTYAAGDSHWRPRTH